MARIVLWLEARTLVLIMKTRTTVKNALQSLISYKGDSTMRIRPLSDRILIERIEEENKTKGGIIIPDTAKEKPMRGKVIAVDKGKVAENGKLIAPDVKKGDQILFSKYAGTEVKIDGKEHLIIREDDVLGIIGE